MPIHCSISLLLQLAPFQPILMSLGLWRHEAFGTVSVLLVSFHLWQFCVWLCQFFKVLLCVTNGSVSEPTNPFVYMKVLCWIWNFLSHFSNHILAFLLFIWYLHSRLSEVNHAIFWVNWHRISVSFLLFLTFWSCNWLFLLMTWYGPCHLAANFLLLSGSNNNTLSPGFSCSSLAFWS